jgi:hypothetical protein
MGKNKENKSKNANRAKSPEESLNESKMSVKEQELAANPAFQAVNGITYRKLKPEVKKTIEKVVY